jgi:hypothetical protein
MPGEGASNPDIGQASPDEAFSKVRRISLKFLDFQTRCGRCTQQFFFSTRAVARFLHLNLSSCTVTRIMERSLSNAHFRKRELQKERTALRFS